MEASFSLWDPFWGLAEAAGGVETGVGSCRVLGYGPKAGTPPSLQPPVSWVVPVADKLRFDEIFLKTDLDLDGYVSGQEAKDIFLHSGLPQSLLAHIW